MWLIDPYISETPAKLIKKCRFLSLNISKCPSRGPLAFILSKDGITPQEGKNCYWERGWKIFSIIVICGFLKFSPTRKILFLIICVDKEKFKLNCEISVIFPSEWT